MSNISILSALISGVQRNVDLSANTLVVDTLKVGGPSGTDLTKTVLDGLIAATGASTALDNLTTTSINQDLNPATDATESLGTSTKRWIAVNAQNVNASDISTTGMAASGSVSSLNMDVNGTLVVLGAATMHAGLDMSSTSITNVVNPTAAQDAATKDYVDTAITGATGANAALSNLASVAINTSLLPASNNAIDLGSSSIHWRTAYSEAVDTKAIQNGSVTIIDLVQLQLNDSSGNLVGSWKNAANNGSGYFDFNGNKLSGVHTPAALDDAATKGYVDSAITVATGANKALSNLTTTSIGVDLNFNGSRSKSTYAGILTIASDQSVTFTVTPSVGSPFTYTFNALAADSPAVTAGKLVAQINADSALQALGYSAYIEGAAGEWNPYDPASYSNHTYLKGPAGLAYTLTNDNLTLIDTFAGNDQAAATGIAKKVTNLAAPSASGDATNKQYVDTADALKAPLASPALTGTPTAPTAAALDNSTKIATTAYVDSAVSAIPATDVSHLIHDNGSVPFAANQAMGSFKLTGLAAATANGDAVRFEQAVLADGSHAITGNQSFSSTAKITNLVDPTAAQDGATKAYVDNAIAGLSWKQAAVAASTANVSVASAPATIDGHTLVAGERVLLKDQTAPAENGIYVFSAAASPLVRASDADTWNEIVGFVIYVESGTANGGSKWVDTNVTGGTIDTTAITVTLFAAASALDGVGTTGYNSYWTAAHTLAAEQYVAAVRGGLATDASAFTGVVKASSGVFSAATIVNTDIDAAAAIGLAKLAPVPANKALISSGGGVISDSPTTADELGYVSGVTSAIQTQINAKAPLASPALTGVPTAPTASPGANSTQLATTAYVDSALTGISSETLSATATVGEAFAITTLRAVRYAKAADTGFVAGRVYKADNDATTTDNFYTIGLVLPAGALTAGQTTTMVKRGLITATAHGFTVGAPIYLGAAGALTNTAPSTTALAVVRVGIAKDANTIDVDVQVVGVN